MERHSDRTTTARARSAAVCPACGTGSGLNLLYALSDIPVQSTLLLRERTTAVSFPTGDMSLNWCQSCGLAFNASFDPARVDYSTGYEDTQTASATFTSFATNLAKDWIKRHELRGRHLVEIGCGKGDFLRLICEHGECTGAGYDPAYVSRGASEVSGLEFHARNFELEDVPIAADFVICRHTLEHVGPVADFLGLMRKACGNSDTIRMGFEVPDLRRILIEGAFWDIYYEHAAYFTAGSLARAFLHAGFNILNLERVYGEQYLVIEVAPAHSQSLVDQASLPPIAQDTEETAALIGHFRRTGIAQIEAWRERFAQWRDSGLSVALWGSGSKAVAFLTTIAGAASASGKMAGSDALSSVVVCVADINPARTGYYMPGCAMPIVAPESLKSFQPDIVIVMNSIYLDEITRDLQAMNLTSLVLTLDDTSAGARS